MPCAISITQVIGMPVSGGSNVQVSGTASGCTRVMVSVGCSGSPAPSIQRVDVSADGSWIENFYQLPCKCAEPIHVEAQCSTDSSCKAPAYDGMLACGPPCPGVSVSVSQGDCSNGKRDVTLTANITTANLNDLVFTQWDFGDGSVGVAETDNKLNQSRHGYAAGTYIANLTVKWILAFRLLPARVSRSSPQPRLRERFLWQLISKPA